MTPLSKMFSLCINRFIAVNNITQILSIDEGRYLDENH
jgi:hypothetical protein